MKKYSFPILLLLTSFLLSRYSSFNGVLKFFIALPGVGVLITFFLDIITERIKSYYNLVRQDKQNDFSLGTASHMATVAYDKHVQFCEEYINEVEKTFDELFVNGTNKNTGNLAVPLVRIRRRHTAWLTRKLEMELIDYEHSLIEIGVSHSKLEYTANPEDRKEIAHSITENLISLLDNDSESSVRVNSINRIRKILEIDTLTEIRSRIAKEALNRLTK